MAEDPNELQAEVARLRAENEALKSQAEAREIRLKVSEKGGVSLYGIRRFPVTFYRGRVGHHPRDGRRDPELHPRE